MDPTIDGFTRVAPVLIKLFNTRVEARRLMPSRIMLALLVALVGVSRSRGKRRMGEYGVLTSCVAMVTLAQLPAALTLKAWPTAAFNLMALVCTQVALIVVKNRYWATCRKRFVALPFLVALVWM